MKSNFKDIENQELIQKLIDSGYGNLVEIFLNNGVESKKDSKKTTVYTRKNRLNKSGACRALGYKPKELEDAFAACREILKGSVDE